MSRFTKKTLNIILEEVIDEYFADGYQGGLWEAVKHVKSKYQEEISALPEE